MNLGRTPRGLPVIALLCVIAACGPLDEPRLMTCTTWLTLPVEQRIGLADRLIGRSGELVERIRVVQHEAPGTPRDVLIRDVESSLTKNCEVWLPRTRTIGELLDALYR